MLDFLKELDYTPLWISFRTGVVATILCFLLGIFAAQKATKASARIRAVLDGLLTLPMVLPPTAAGFMLLLLFSTRRPFGAFLYDNFHIRVIQNWSGCVLAASVIAFPLMYRNARAAFDLLDVDLIHAGRTLGMTEAEIFFKVVLPTAGPGIASGTVLTFARAMGEYGATSMLAGNIPGRTETISQKIAMVIQDGDYIGAGVWVLLVAAFALVVLVIMNRLSGGKGNGRW